MLHGIQRLTATLKGVPISHTDSQLLAIPSLQGAINTWGGGHTPKSKPTQPMDQPTQPTPTAPHGCPRKRMERLLAAQLVPRAPAKPAPPTTQVPWMYPAPIDQPMALQTRSRVTQPSQQSALAKPVTRKTRSATTHTALHVTNASTAQLKYPLQLLDLWCTPVLSELAVMPVLDEEIGQILEFWQLRRHPKYTGTWVASYTNKLGCLF